MSDHYIECVDLDCAGCLPSDVDVAAMNAGRAQIELRRRGLPVVPTGARKVDAVLANADDYRTRSAAARALLFP